MDEAKKKANKLPVYQGVVAYFPRAIREVARVSQFGVNKHGFDYSDRGFLTPNYPTEGYADAILRHMTARAIEGEINFEDGECYHLAQVAWDALAALERTLIERETND